MRRRVRDDVQPAFGGRHELVRSLKTTESQLAEKRRDDVWREWDTAIAEARRRTVAETTLPRLLQAVDD